MENTRLNKTRAIEIQEVNGELPHYIKLAIGNEVGKGWYLQTSSKKYEAEFSKLIVEGADTFEEVEELGKRLSEIFGVELDYWNWKEEGVEEISAKQEKQASLVRAVWTNEEVIEYMKDYYSHIELFISENGGVCIRLYGVFDKRYNLKRLSPLTATIVQSSSKYDMVKLEYTLEKYNDSGLIDGLIVDINAMVSNVDGIRYNEQGCIDYFNNVTSDERHFLKAMKKYAKNNGIEIDENGNIILYEVGIGVGGSYDGRLSVGYTTSKIDDDKNHDITLVKHLIQLNDGLNLGTEFIDSIISDVEQSKLLLFFNDEVAHNHFENAVERPPLKLIKSDLQEIADKLYHCHNELFGYTDTFSTNNKELKEFSDELDDMYDKLQLFIDHIKN